jgi:pimeloyl-ACP methyl ester carboxylesterase
MSLDRIVLVHGAWHGAWCWEMLAPLLEERGYEVSTLDLPGLGDDRTPRQDVTLSSYIDRVVGVVDSGRTPVLLVGHSMGGVPISGAGEVGPGMIGKLVYLAALLPQDGESLLAVAGVGAAGSQVIQPNTGDGAHAVDRSIARQLFYNCCAAEVAERASQRLRPQALGPLHTPVTLTEERWGRIPKTYIVCARDHALPTAQQLLMCERRSEVKKLVMDTDHSPFYSDPDGLAQILDREARRGDRE